MAQPSVDAGLLAFVALVPLLLVARSPRHGALAGLVAGMLYFGIFLDWTFKFAWIGWLALVVFLSLGYVLFGAVAGWAQQRRIPAWGVVLLLPSVLAVQEWIQDRWPLGGFAWGNLGVSQHGIAFTRAAAALGGVALLTWLVVAVNVAVVLAVRRRPGAATAVAGLVVAGFTIAWLVRPDAAPSGRLTTAVVQGNHWPDGDETSDEMLASHLAITSTLPGKADLVVWGESSVWTVPVTDDVAQAIDTASHGVPVLANAYVVGPNHTFRNENILFENGRAVWTYTKRHRVPFGEYVPLRPVLAPLFRQFDRVPNDAVPGRRLGLFSIDGQRLATMICFESVFGDPARVSVAAGGRALVVTTNNASFDYSDAASQYIALSSLRAVETHRAEVISAVGGRSALIAPDGRILRRTGLFRDATLQWDLPLQGDRTLYVKVGDVVVPLSTLGIVLVIVLTASSGRTLRRRTPATHDAQGGRT